MHCLTEQEMIYYLECDFQDHDDHTNLKNHINSCSDCQNKIRNVKHKLNSFLIDNSNECELIQNVLQDFIEEKITIVSGIDINEHLKECEACNYLYLQLKKEPTLSEIVNLEIALPDSLKHKMNTLIEKLRKTPKKLKSNVFDRLDELAETILLTLFPAPAPAFLTDTLILSAVKIQITKETLLVNAEKPGLLVKIYSLNDDELDQQITDENGVAAFKDFEPDTYKIAVEGYEIKGVEKL